MLMGWGIVRKKSWGRGTNPECVFMNKQELSFAIILQILRDCPYIHLLPVHMQRTCENTYIWESQTWVIFFWETNLYHTQWYYTRLVVWGLLLVVPEDHALLGTEQSLCSQSSL